MSAKVIHQVFKAIRLIPGPCTLKDTSYLRGLVTKLFPKKVSFPGIFMTRVPNQSLDPKENMLFYGEKGLV